MSRERADARPRPWWASTIVLCAVLAPLAIGAGIDATLAACAEPTPNVVPWPAP